MEHPSSIVILISLALLCTTAVESAPTSPERKVVRFYWPECKQIRVNASDVREIFVTDCRLNHVIVFGDESIKIRDFHNNIRSKYLCIFTKFRFLK